MGGTSLHSWVAGLKLSPPVTVSVMVLVRPQARIVGTRRMATNGIPIGFIVAPLAMYDYDQDAGILVLAGLEPNETLDGFVMRRTCAPMEWKKQEAQEGTKRAGG